MSNVGFFNDDSEYLFLDIIERNFIWENKSYIITRPWSGFIHCTPFDLPYLKNSNINNLFLNNNFLNSLPYCKCILTLSSYITRYLKIKFDELNINIKIYTLKHPTETKNIKEFDIKKYMTNPKKKIIQIGQQLRKLSSIYLLNMKDHEKVWLTGTENMNKCNFLLKSECNYLKINVPDKKDVLVHYTKSFEEYDNLLSENIVLLDFFDTAANNSIVECIFRNTPFFCKRLEGTIEYLGIDYPLFFNNISEIQEINTIENITKAYEYLKNKNKEELYIDYFIKKMCNIFALN